MNNIKKASINIFGLIVAILAYIISTYIFSFIFGLLLKIPFLVKILSWPFSVNYYISTALNIATVCIAITAGSWVCSKAGGAPVGAIIFAFGIIALGLVALIYRLVTVGYSYVIVGYIFGMIASGCYLVETLHKTKAAV